MYGLSFMHILVVGLVILILFGRNTFSNTMKDIAGGIKNFRAGIKEIDNG